MRSIVVGLVVGGLGTATLGSCDAEPGRDDGVAELEPAAQLPIASGFVCDPAARPSVFVYVAREVFDELEGVPVERVWFEHEGSIEDASCAGVDIDVEEDGCPVWIAGWEEEGRFVVSAEWCGRVVSEAVTVGLTDDGCHVQTELVVLRVDVGVCGGTDR
jgi:hypothetical protein